MLPVSLIPDVLPTPNRRPTETIEVETVESPPPVPVSATVVSSSTNVLETVDEMDAASMEQTTTLRQLKEMCTQRSLSTAGKKGDLVARILTHDRSKTELE